MKKLLLFIVALFGILSVQSFAWNYGCGENIPPYVCGADGSNNNNNVYTPTRSYLGAIAVDLETGRWASASSYGSIKEAKESVISRCGKDCLVIPVERKRCVGLAYSAQDKIAGYDSATDAILVGYDTRVKRSNEKALSKCEKNGGKNCKVIVNVCAVEGTTEY